MSVVFAALYAFFIFESIASGVARAIKEGRGKRMAVSESEDLILQRVNTGGSEGRGRVHPSPGPLFLPNGEPAPQSVARWHGSYGHAPYGYYSTSQFHTPDAISMGYDNGGFYESGQGQSGRSLPYALPHEHTNGHHPIINGYGNGHSHNSPLPIRQTANGSAGSHKRKPSTGNDELMSVKTSVVANPVVAEHGHSHGDLNDSPTLCCGFKAVAWMILMGDAVHNFADGIAVGASFVVSNSAGVSTLVAVACHELPHEIGDFAVLLDSGMGVWKALFLNFLSALTAFAGLYIGINLGKDDNIRPWLFALTAGMFIYVALVDMLSHLKTMGKGESWWINCIFQNIGLLLGFTIIFLLGWYEEMIVFP